MKLRSVTISNVRSFTVDSSGSNRVEFRTDMPNGLMGPNGSGKSNLLEIAVPLTLLGAPITIEHVIASLWSQDPARFYICGIVGARI